MYDPEILITSTRNSQIVNARKLGQRKHRERQSQFLVEGLPLLRMALNAGARAIKVFYCRELLADDETLTLLTRFSAETETFAVSEKVMASLCERTVPGGVIATFELSETTVDQLVLPERSLVLVLDRLQDPGNVGTLIRTADAAGATAMALIEPCADPFDPKTVRASMGSVFNVPIVRVRDLAPLFDRFMQSGLRIVGTDVHKGIVWGRGLLHGSVALILGNEARGQSDDVSAYVEANASLPIVGKAESLNVAIAGGILVYAWLRANWV